MENSKTINKRHLLAQKSLSWLFFLVLTMIVAVTFYQYCVAKNYVVTGQVPCDPSSEKCYQTVCDPAEDPDCPEVEADRVSYYKYVEKKAADVNLCDSTSVGCDPLVCSSGENCIEIWCNEETVSDGESCASVK